MYRNLGEAPSESRGDAKETPGHNAPKDTFGIEYKRSAGPTRPFSASRQRSASRTPQVPAPLQLSGARNVDAGIPTAASTRSNGKSPFVGVGARENFTSLQPSNAVIGYSAPATYGMAPYGMQAQEPLMHIPSSKMNGYTPMPTGSMSLQAPSIDPPMTMLLGNSTNHAIPPVLSNSTSGMTAGHASMDNTVPAVGMSTLFGDWYPPPVPFTSGLDPSTARPSGATGPITADQMTGWLEKNATRQLPETIPNSAMSAPTSGRIEDEEEVLQIESQIVPGFKSSQPVGSANGYNMATLRNMNPAMQREMHIGQYQPGDSLNSPTTTPVTRLIGVQELKVFFPSVEQRRQASLMASYQESANATHSTGIMSMRLLTL